jgi:hypothetical protein
MGLLVGCPTDDAGDDDAGDDDAGDDDAGDDDAGDDDTGEELDFSDRPALGMTVNGCGDVPPDGEGDVIAEYAALGADFYTLRADWATLEQDPAYAGLIQWGIPWLADLGYAVMLTIPTVDTVIATIPDAVVGLAWDDPAMLAAFDTTLESLITPQVAAALSYVALGNEVDGYLHAHPDELEAYATFVAHGYAKLDELGVTAPSCVTFMVDGLSQGGEDALNRLLPDCDFLPVTYYPMAAGFQFEDPAIVVVPAFDLVQSWAGDLPVVFQEVGYSSDPANGGSEMRQAEFLVWTLMTAIDRNDQVQALNVDWRCDLLLEDCQDLAENLYQVPPENPMYDAFVGFLCSLGLRYQDGSPKLGHAVFEQAIAATPAAAVRTSEADCDHP